jgi:hypothetical protein
MPPAAEIRKAVKLRQSVHHDLTIYALVAGAAGVSVLALARPADAEVVVTTVNQIVGRDGHYAIQLNHEGAVEFVIANSVRGGTSHFFYFKDRMAIAALAGAKVATSEGDAACLTLGQGIGAGNAWKDKSILLESTYTLSTGVYSAGHWFRKDNRYLGLQFQINGQTHYGWARVSVRNFNAGEMQVGISSFAYETKPDTAIRAGQTKDNTATSSLSRAPEATFSSSGSGALARANRGPTGEVFVTSQPEPERATLGSLALGAGGLAIWRRP